MSLYPGAPRVVNGTKVLDDTALANSMAKAIDDALADLYQQLKNTPLPDDGKDDRRMLFAAIARGVLLYLRDHEVSMTATVTTTGAGGTFTVGNFDLHVTADQHTPHA